MSSCVGPWPWHKYEARYDEVQNQFPLKLKGASTAKEIRSLMIHNKYVHDICVRCGDVIERKT